MSLDLSIEWVQGDFTLKAQVVINMLVLSLLCLHYPCAVPTRLVLCLLRLCSVSRLALHRAAMPNIFLSFIFFLLVFFRRLSTLLLPMCVILVFLLLLAVFCYFATSCVPSLTPSQCSVAALSYDFTDEVILTDEVSTVRFVAAWLPPLKEYRAPIVRTPGDATSRQECQPAWLFGNLAVD